MRFDTQAQQIAAHYRVNFRIVNRLFITVFKTAARMTHMMNAVGKALTRRAKAVRTLGNIILSPSRVFLSGCGKARLAGNSVAIAKHRNAAAAAQEQPNVKIMLTRVLSRSTPFGDTYQSFTIPCLLRPGDSCLACWASPNDPERFLWVGSATLD